MKAIRIIIIIFICIDVILYFAIMNEWREKIEEFIKNSIYPITYLDESNETWIISTTVKIGNIRYYTFKSTQPEHKESFDTWMQRIKELSKERQEIKYKELCSTWKSKLRIFLLIKIGRIKKIAA